MAHVSHDQENSVMQWLLQQRRNCCENL